MTDKMNRAIDKTLYLLPFAIIAAFFIHTWWTNASPTKAAVGITFSAIVFVATFGALLTKEIGARGFWIVKKEEKPGLFWAEFVAQLVVGLLVLVYAFI
jgi:hypothetical protein